MSEQPVVTSLNGNALQRFERDEILVDSDTREESNTMTPARMLSIAWRRKWIVLFFFILGLTIGYVFTSQKVSIYQGSAQVMVVRKREPTIASSLGGDSRIQILDDFITTQTALLKSELILQSAAQKLRSMDIGVMGDQDQIAGMLGGGLSVRRDQDAAGRGGNILILSFRSSSREKCPLYLDAIIWSYQDFLRNKYDVATDAEINQIKQTLKEMDEEQKQAEKEFLDNNLKSKDVLDENLEDLRKRVSATREMIDSLNRKKTSIQSKLEMIAKVASSTSLTEQKAALTQLLTQDAGGNVALARSKEFEAELVRLEGEMQQKMKSLGRSHPDVISLRSRIEFLRDQSRNLKSGMSDNYSEQLDFYRIIYTGELKNIAEDLSALQGYLDRDLPKTVKLSLLTTSNLAYEEKKKRAATRTEELQKNKKALESTRESGGYNATVINPPNKSPVFKVEPNPVQGAMTGGVLGLLIGLAFGGLAEFFDKTFHTPEEIRRRLGRFVIGHIPIFRLGNVPALALGSSEDQPIADPSIVSYHDPRSRDAEAVRGLRTSLYFSTFGRGHQVIQITSPNPGDGKSTIVSNLAVSIAQSGKKTILIDADFRRPKLHKLFHRVSGDFGLSSLITREKQLHEVIQESGIPNLYILPVGIRPKNPSELLSSAVFKQVLDKIRDEFEFVLIDTPPLLAVSDPSAIATRVDGVILVIRIRPKIRPTAERANNMLSSLGANVLGVIVNSAHAGAGSGARYGKGYNYGYNYGYGYRYGYGYNYKYNYDYEYSEAYSSEEERKDPPASHNGVERLG